MTDEGFPLSDRSVKREVSNRQVQHAGAKWSLVTDQVHLADDELVTRDVVVHPGAVGVLALDDDDNVILIRQYRHPMAAELWEIPAGLLDTDGEDPWDTARRELFEEAHLLADEWHLLIDLFSSPGMSSEIVRIYLARGLHDVPEGDRHIQTEEERDMPVRKVPLDLACDWAVQGRLHNAMAVAGLLAAERARTTDWVSLREPATDWPGSR